MTIEFEQALHRLFNIYPVKHEQEIIEWIISIHEDEVKRIIGLDRDLSTYEDLLPNNFIFTDLDEYQANFIDSFGRNQEHEVQRQRAGIGVHK